MREISAEEVVLELLADWLTKSDTIIAATRSDDDASRIEYSDELPGSRRERRSRHEREEN